MAHKHTYRARRAYCYCSGKGKIAYATRDAAHAARNRHGAALLRVYECPRSTGWHLTSKL